jgi:hypothetical protein
MADNRRWFHAILTVYGAWLSGDPRGFRSRHHREHIDGDYKDPPPAGKYATYERFSRRALKQAPVVVQRDLRPTLGQALREKLEKQGALVVCMSVSGQHVHILVKMLPGLERQWLGAAKRHAWFVLNDLGWTTKLWAKRGKALPIRDRQHQLNVYRYIMRHAQQGAWVWSMLQKE